MSGLDINDTITISQVALPEGAKPTIDRDFVICNVSAPSALKSDEEEEEAAADADEVPTVADEAEAAEAEGAEE